MTYTEILLSVDAGVATLTLNRPDKLNSFTTTMHREIREALDEVARNPAIRALLITGAGRGFNAGQDLADLQSGGRSLKNVLEEDYKVLAERIQALPKPVICAVNGIAAGAGANLAFACDLTLAAKSANFLQAFVHIGLMPDCGGTWFLPQRVGMQRALGLAMLGEKLSAEQAAQWGLIWQVVDDAELLPTAQALAAKLAKMPTQALGAMKHAMQQAWSNTLSQQMSLECTGQAALGESHDYQEGVQAFLEKRPAKFLGK